MVDSIGRVAVGRSVMVGRKRENYLRRTIRKAEQWRDKARINLFQQRKAYQRKVEANKALMRAKKAGKLPNLNPSSCLSRLFEDGLMPKSRMFAVTHSTVPAKPKYSVVKPAERIYGNRWVRFDQKAVYGLEISRPKVPVKLKDKSKHTLIRSKETIYRRDSLK